MIKNNELRIGNLVKYRWSIIKVDSIDRSGINLKSVYNKYACQDQVVSRVKFKDMNPIPLTEEWLVKLWPQYKDYGIKNNGDSIWFSYTSERYMEINHVHQLQNLFYSLTGEELTIK